MTASIKEAAILCYLKKEVACSLLCELTPAISFLLDNCIDSKQSWKTDRSLFSLIVDDIMGVRKDQFHIKQEGALMKLLFL